MIKKCCSFALCCLLIATANAAFLSAQTPAGPTDAKAAEIKTAVQKRGTGEKKRVTVRLLDGTKLKGYISRADDDSFTLVEAKTKADRAIAYRDVAKISNRSTSGDKIALWVVTGAVATVAVVLLGILKIRCDNEGGC